MLMEKLTRNDKELINFMRESFSDTSSDFFSGEFVGCDYFLRFWEEAKAPMADAFGGNLIVRSPITAAIEDEELHDRMELLMNTSEYYGFRNALRNVIEANNTDFFDRVLLDPNSNDHYSINECLSYFLLTPDCWISNRYDGPTFEVRMPNSTSRIKVANGCKVMKILGRLIKATGIARSCDDFEFLRLRQSQILNEARITADLCISIHPMDFITASYNANDWRSCMCWDDGEYRRGVIEMMNSPIVVVAYIESRKEHLVLGPYNTWNSKKWREFFIVTPDCISGIKGYPYWNRGLEDAVLLRLREMFAPIFKVQYDDEITNWHYCQRRLDTMRSTGDRCIPDFDCGPAMYNDFYNGNFYHTIFRDGFKAAEEDDYRLSLCYSGASECVCCGEEVSDCEFSGESAIICDHCVTVYSCCSCGDTITRSRDLFLLDGNAYCRYCYENLPTCSCCHEAMVDTSLQEDTILFCVGIDRDTTAEVLDDEWRGWPKEFTVCAECAKKIFKNMVEELTSEHRWYRSSTMIIPYYALSEEGVKMVGEEALNKFLAKYNKDEKASA